MNIDERLERLTERHEAITQSLELFQHDTGEKIRALAAIAEQNEARAAKILEAIATQQARAARMEATVYRSFEDIRDSLQRLERIAIAHERRLDDIQGN
jgi:transcriptional regulator NrdR family protein